MNDSTEYLLRMVERMGREGWRHELRAWCDDNAQRWTITWHRAPIERVREIPVVPKGAA